MKNVIKVLFAMLPLLFSYQVWSQAYNISTAKVTINGTSTAHDWDMTSQKGGGTARITLGSDGRISSIQAINFAMNAKTLKSKSTTMDGIAYKALKADKNPNITFSAPGATVTTTDGTNYQIKTSGKLSIAGSSKNVDLTFTGKLNADKSLTVTGTKAIDMKDWGVEPPSFMFGAMKTGKDITISINSTLK